MSRHLKSLAFRRAREENWVALEALCKAAESSGLRSLDAAQLERLPVLYRAALSSLSVARAISLDRALLAYLEALCARAYLLVYSTQRPFWEAVSTFFRRRFPRAVRRNLGAIAVSAAALVAGTVIAAILTAANADTFYEFIPPEYANGRDPMATTEYLRGTLYDGGERLGSFASFLFSNNARIGIFAFALGFLFAVPTVLLLFVNGLTLGAFLALFYSRGLGFEVWGWLLPHGITELGAVILCGGAGLVLSYHMVVPGRYTRLRNLALNGRDAGVIVLGAVVMLFGAALIEGFFRQLVHDDGIRYLFAATTGAFWLGYFALAGRGPDHDFDAAASAEPPSPKPRATVR